MIATIVDTDALLQVIWVSIVAGVGLTASYGFAILGATRAVEFGRDGRVMEAAVFAVIGVVGFGVAIASIVFGILTLIND